MPLASGLELVGVEHPSELAERLCGRLRAMIGSPEHDRAPTHGQRWPVVLALSLL